MKRKLKITVNNIYSVYNTISTSVGISEFGLFDLLVALKMKRKLKITLNNIYLVYNIESASALFKTLTTIMNNTDIISTYWLKWIVEN